MHPAVCVWIPSGMTRCHAESPVESSEQVAVQQPPSPPRHGRLARFYPRHGIQGVAVASVASGDSDGCWRLARFRRAGGYLIDRSDGTECGKVKLFGAEV